MFKLIEFAEDDSGSTAIEYAIILILCSTAMIAALYDTRDSLNGMITSAGDGLSSAISGP